MNLQGKKIGILIESDYYEKEISYYKLRFEEEGVQVDLLTRLWGQQRLTFEGHEYKIKLECDKSFENMSDEDLSSYDAIIVPAGYVADRLKYTEDINKLPPACEFLKRVFHNKNIIKGIICHGLWLTCPIPEVVQGRKVVCHNNLLGEVRNMGAIYTNEDVVIDDDLITARTGDTCNKFARTILERIHQKSLAYA